MSSLEQEVGTLLRQKKFTLGLVESATSGLISYLITNVPGSSDYYKGSVTAYGNQVKINLVGVKKETINKHGAVSSQVAEEMAQGGRRVLGADICLTDTGIAGPGGATKEKPAGLFYIGLSHQSRTYSRKYNFHWNRRQNKEAAAEAALSWLREYLLGSKLKIEDRGLIGKEIPEKHVVTCFLEYDAEILILRRSEMVGSYKGMWAGVSGYVETTAYEQALIEIEEETGLCPEDVELVRKGNPIDAENEGTKWVVHPYLFQIKERNKVRIDWEHNETRWIKPGDIDNYQTVPKLKKALARVYQL